MNRKVETGYNHPFEIRRESYTAAGISEGFSVLYLSDFHFNARGAFLAQGLIRQITILNPTIILLGGDYVDTKKGIYYLDEVLRSVSARENVYAVAGNHDYFFGLEKIKKVMTANRVCWIEKGSAELNWNNCSIRIDGNKPAAADNRASFSILCLHTPQNIVPYAARYNLVFAGHLHGCQAVLWETEKGMYPGRWFYRWNIRKARFMNCHYHISKGLGDTLPIRYNCSKDLIFVEINPLHT